MTTHPTSRSFQRTSAPDPALGPKRRTLLLGGLAGIGAAVLEPTAWTPARASDTPTSGRLPLITPLEPGLPRRSEFAPEEQRYAPYLVTLAAMANDIDDSDTELRGFMAGGWWRTPAAPFNARISEQVFTLSWFYANERSWNPYRRDPALLARLDIAIDFYLRLQHDDGTWPEYSPDEHSRAATAFALGYLSKTLANLRSVGALPERCAEIASSLRQAMVWFLDPTNTAVWQPERIEFMNQATGGLAGSAKALSLDADRRLSHQLRDRVFYLREHAQSPAGFLYEPLGMDIGYNLNVTLAEIHEIHTYMGGNVLLPMVHRLAEWFGYVMVPEPDGSGLIAFASGAARTPMYYLDDATIDRQQRDIGSLFCQMVPALRPFFTTREDRDAARAEWAASTEEVAALAPGDTNPRIPANIPFGEAYPSRRQKTVATSLLPAVHDNRFTELRSDPQDQHYLFTRRPAYYLQAFLGTRPNGVVRAGFGMLWHPRAGVFVHSGQNSNTECWATLLRRDGVVLGTDGASNLTPTFFDGPVSDGHVVDTPVEIARVGDLGLRWTTTSDNVTGEALLSDHSVFREITTRLDGVEQVPLVLLPEDDVRWGDGTSAPYASPSAAEVSRLSVTRNGVTLTIDWEDQQSATVTPTNRRYFHDGRRRAHVLRIPHQFHGRIMYTFSE